jgi:type III secretory pathway component EscV
MPRLHERQQIVTEARMALMEALVEWAEQYEEVLTPAEYLATLVGESTSVVQSNLKYQIRYERHGNTDTPGGWAAT